MQRTPRIELIAQAALAAQRRRQLAGWQERFDQLQRIKPRSDSERQAQTEALELLKMARP